MLNYPRVAIDFMNNDHAEFVALRKYLLDLLHTGADHAQVDAMLDSLLEHTRLHFAEEEKLMLSAQFQPYPMHKGEHDKVLNEMIARIEKWKIARDAKVSKTQTCIYLTRLLGRGTIKSVRCGKRAHYVLQDADRAIIKS